MRAADRPAYEFNSAITVGMSAPPMGRIRSTPKARASATKIGKSHIAPGQITRATPHAAARARIARLRTFWFLYVMGRPGRSSWSLPKAMRLPVKVRKPRSISRARMLISNVPMALGPVLGLVR